MGHYAMVGVVGLLQPLPLRESELTRTILNDYL